MNTISFHQMAAITVILATHAVAAAATSRYQVVDLGKVNTFDIRSIASGINAQGQITGTGVGQAFFADGNTLAPITPGLGLSINDSGQIAGFNWDLPQNGVLRAQAFRWAGGSVQRIGVADSFGLGINNRGLVSGALKSVADDGFRAFIWDGGTPQLLGTLGGANSYGTGINDNGWVTGAADDDNGNMRAFVWNGSEMQDLGTLGGENFPSSYGVAINRQGWVTGSSFHYDEDFNPVYRAFLWDGATLSDLGGLTGSTKSYGYAINDLGQVVGSSIDFQSAIGFGFGTASAYQNEFAFLYDSGNLWKLNELLDPVSADWNILLATGINDNGQIAASGCHPQLGCRALRLEPISAVPLPPGAVMLLSGLVMMGWRWRPGGFGQVINARR